MNDAASTFLVGMSSLIGSIKSVGEFVWGLFGDFLGMILNNPVIAFPILFGVLAGAIGIVVKMTRKFGVKGKR